MRYKRLVLEEPVLGSSCVRQTWESDFWVKQETAHSPPWIDKFDNGGRKIRKRYIKFLVKTEATNALAGNRGEQTND